jgi:hypothetical protein
LNIWAVVSFGFNLTPAAGAAIVFEAIFRN